MLDDLNLHPHFGAHVSLPLETRSVLVCVCVIVWNFLLQFIFTVLPHD